LDNSLIFIILFHKNITFMKKFIIFAIFFLFILLTLQAGSIEYEKQGVDSKKLKGFVFLRKTLKTNKFLESYDYLTEKSSQNSCFKSVFEELNRNCKEILDQNKIIVHNIQIMDFTIKSKSMRCIWQNVFMKSQGNNFFLVIFWKPQLNARVNYTMKIGTPIFPSTIMLTIYVSIIMELFGKKNLKRWSIPYSIQLQYPKTSCNFSI